MKILKYYNLYSPEDTLFFDWRIQAMNIAESVVIFYCRCEFRGMDYDDVAQELRLHLWNNLLSFNPKRASIRTWSDRVVKNKLIDLRRSKREFLDSPVRKHIPESEQSRPSYM